MARRDREGDGGNSDGFEGRDLLIGRPEPAAASGEADAGHSTKSPPVPAPTADSDDRHRESLARLAAIETQLKSLKALMESGREADRALAREVAALGKGEERSRGVLAAVVELAEERKAEAAAAARVLDEGVARLTEQGEGLERRLDQTSLKAETVAGALNQMSEAAGRFTKRLDSLSGTISREVRDRRLSRSARALALAATVVVSIALGALVQRETFFLTFGDPRHEWNAYFVEHYAQRLSECASEAWALRTRIRCGLIVGPSLPVPVSVSPGAEPGVPPAGESADSTAKR